METDKPRPAAVIGGTGLSELSSLERVVEHQLDTPFGAPSGPVLEGVLAGRRVYFLQRHGTLARIPPHRVNYRANLWALRSLGVGEVIAINAVGGISVAMQPGTLVVPDQLIDYTWGREHSVDDGSNGPLQHIDFTEPYDPALRQALLAAAAGAGVACVHSGVHGITQGPRLETAAEIRRMAADGCDLVGMTGMPEAALARELGLAYASLCLVVNLAAGLSEELISLERMQDILRREAGAVRQLLGVLLTSRYGVSDPGS